MHTLRARSPPPPPPPPPTACRLPRTLLGKPPSYAIAPRGGACPCQRPTSGQGAHYAYALLAAGRARQQAEESAVRACTHARAAPS